MRSIPLESCIARQNHLLGGLHADEWSKIASCFHCIELRYKEELVSIGSAVNDVYFPCTSVLALVVRDSSGAASGISLIGNEGFLGMEAVTDRPTALQAALCQTPGLCLGIKRHHFAWAMRHVPALRSMAMHHLHTQLREFSQFVICNQLHDIEQRLVKWILMTADRSGPELFLTQELLAELLGAHRPGVSLAAAQLQQAGLISYRRGHMKILDRARLEDRCCACYGAMRRNADAASGEQVAARLSILSDRGTPPANSANGK